MKTNAWGVSFQLDTPENCVKLILHQVSQECDSCYAAPCQHKRDRKLRSESNGGAWWFRNLDSLERAGLLSDGNCYGNLNQGQA